MESRYLTPTFRNVSVPATTTLSPWAWIYRPVSIFGRDIEFFAKTAAKKLSIFGRRPGGTLNPSSFSVLLARISSLATSTQIFLSLLYFWVPSAKTLQWWQGHTFVFHIVHRLGMSLIRVSSDPCARPHRRQYGLSMDVDQRRNIFKTAHETCCCRADVHIHNIQTWLTKLSYTIHHWYTQNLIDFKPFFTANVLDTLGRMCHR